MCFNAIYSFSIVGLAAFFINNVNRANKYHAREAECQNMSLQGPDSRRFLSYQQNCLRLYPKPLELQLGGKGTQPHGLGVLSERGLR